MAQQLYPLTFRTIFKDKIWGGEKIKTVLEKDFSPLPNCGETWELSGVKGNVSVVKEGSLAGKPLTELIQQFQGDLVGKKVWKESGEEFPLLVKFIDANDDLSIQVHPDDELGMKRHQSLGKTEMWYIFQADKGANLISGFAKAVDEETYLKHLEAKTLDQILNYEEVTAGDVFFMPAGRVHSIGKGCLLAEIQQTSDITYRIYDFDRKDDKGQTRELHTEQALAAIDYGFYEDYKTRYTPKANEAVELATCKYFETNLLEATQPISRNYNHLDSFVIFVCFEGKLTLEWAGEPIKVQKGDVVLLPAAIKDVTLNPQEGCKVLESYVP